MVSFKQHAADFIGYDPQVTAAASTSQSLSGATSDLPAKVSFLRQVGSEYMLILDYPYSFSLVFGLYKTTLSVYEMDITL